MVSVPVNQWIVTKIIAQTVPGDNGLQAFDRQMFEQQIVGQVETAQ